MTETASTTASAPPTPTWTRWLYPILAVTGVAVGLVVIAAVVYLLFAQQQGCCHPMMKADPPSAQSTDCCAAMMKDMKMPPGQGMSAMPNMPMPAPSR